jgi:Bacterial protein of unknown function (DUF882)
MLSKYKLFLLSLTIFTIIGCENKGRSTKKKRSIVSCLFEMPQKEILTRKGIDSVLAQFKQVKFSQLDSSYRAFSDPKQLRSRTYYLVQGEQVFIPVVGKYRINQFIVRDHYYHNNMKDICGDKIQYWLVDKKMLYMMLDLIQALDKKGYDKYAFSINTSHRHPNYNENKAKGAKFSQHIFGRACDISIKDINKDHIADQRDKKIVLALLEKIVGNKGGLGKYPETMAVHFDCRGFRARWDHQ